MSDNSVSDWCARLSCVRLGLSVFRGVRLANVSDNFVSDWCARLSCVRLGLSVFRGVRLAKCQTICCQTRLSVSR